MKSYCPYTNIESKSYPDILVTASLNDSQVNVLGAGEVHCEIARHENGLKSFALEDEYGVGTWACVRKVRRL